MGSPTPERVRIYQLFVRLFSNTNEQRKPNGTLAENGAGKFQDINEASLASLRDMGFTHLWLTGVLQQATGTDYSSIGEPADDPDLLKGLAGSPYAIKDYYDVCPDYAVEPANRMAEFEALLERIHKAGMKALIDLVPNHVARCYRSSVKPELDFGTSDDRTKFFDPKNNFYHLAHGPDGPPLRLPTVKDGLPVSPTCKIPGMRCDGLFDGEREYGRVTGNNVASWTPSIYDWYETAKLNYGWDFTTQRKAYRTRETPDALIPDTWQKIDAILAYWQAKGVDGFRCDMAHMVPVEFWGWAIEKAHARNAGVYFIGEAYDNDPAKIPSGNNVINDLLAAGFDAIYDDPTYKTLKKIYEGPGWANDIDWAQRDASTFHQLLRYGENHDEVRLSSPHDWDGIGMEIGRAVCGILFGVSRGPVLVYNGQEVGEPGDGKAGFGGDNGRTTIFDYWSMPELAKWVNGHAYDSGGLSEEQKALRLFYKRLLTLISEPAFRDGEFYPLNPANNGNLQFGSTGNEAAGGHWLYAFMRHDPASRQRFLVVVNLHRSVTFRNERVIFPENVLNQMTATSAGTREGMFLQFRERLEGRIVLQKSVEELLATTYLGIPEIPPLTPLYFELVA